MVTYDGNGIEGAECWNARALVSIRGLWAPESRFEKSTVANSRLVTVLRQLSGMNR